MKLILILLVVFSANTAYTQCDTLSSFDKTMSLIRRLSPGFHYSYDSSDHVYKFGLGEIYHPVLSDDKRGLRLEYYFQEDYDKMVQQLNGFLSQCLGKKVELSEKPLLYKTTVIYLLKERQRCISIFYSSIEE